MPMDEKLIQSHMKILGITREEAIQLIEDDRRIDKGEKLFELTAEQKQASKKARQADTCVLCSHPCRRTAAAVVRAEQKSFKTGRFRVVYGKSEHYVR